MREKDSEPEREIHDEYDSAAVFAVGSIMNLCKARTLFYGALTLASQSSKLKTEKSPLKMNNFELPKL